MDQLRFDGRVAVVTGAGRGIGREHALLLASRGARVVVSDLGCATEGGGASSQPADDVVREIVTAGGEAVSSNASVADEAGAASIIHTAMDAFGRVDILVNNAGIFDPGTFDEVTTEQFRAMLDVHLFGTVFVTKAAWPHMVAAGYGRIVNTISEAMLGLPRLVSYGAAKGSIFGFSRNLAFESGARGILVNCIAPWAGTRMGDKQAEGSSIPREVLEKVKATMPASLIAPAAAFLAHESCTLNGEVLQIGAGRVSCLAVIHTKGITMDAPTAEDIAANLDAIMDVSDARVTDLSGLH